MTEFRPAEVFSPGEFIREELEERGWTQDDLAKIIGRNIAAINQIILGKKVITPEIARELAEAFETSPELWLNLETSYRLSLVETEPGTIRKRAALYEVAPVKDMVRRHWIQPTSTCEELERELKRFYGASSLESLPPIALAARTSAEPEKSVIAAQRAWCQRVIELAQCVHAKRYSAEAFKRGCEVLRTLEVSQEGVRKVPRVLSEMGIRFVIVEHLPKTKIDGVALWLNDAPVIAMSLRYERIDWFWHTLAHELSHIRHRDTVGLDIEIMQSEATNEIELRADREAAELLIPRGTLESFIFRIRPLYSKERINQFANTIRVHPGIIVGQLQHRGEIGYQANREMLVPVRDQVISEALTDGWGHFVEMDNSGGN